MKLCPDCQSPLADAEFYEHGMRAAVGDVHRYRCPRCGEFRVSGSAEAAGFWEAQVDDQRRALKNARHQVEGTGKPPTIWAL